jgi:hypothetical protein
MAQFEKTPFDPKLEMFNQILFGSSSKNEVLEGAGFHISYNPNTDCGEETALFHDGNYHILLGDFRSQYLGLMEKGYEACLEFYRSQPSYLRSKYSFDG